MRRAGISLRAVKQERVLTGRAHAALVLAEYDAAQGWCQYGSAEELSNIKPRRVYDKGAPPLPDWRITCFYVDRGQGITRAALEGALVHRHAPRSPGPLHHHDRILISDAPADGNRQVM